MSSCSRGSRRSTDCPYFYGPVIIDDDDDGDVDDDDDDDEDDDDDDDFVFGLSTLNSSDPFPLQFEPFYRSAAQ